MEGNGFLARLARAEVDIVSERAERLRAVERLDDDKADAKDIARMERHVDEFEGRMTAEFKSLRGTLQWFMGLVAGAVVALVILIVQLVGGG